MNHVCARPFGPGVITPILFAITDPSDRRSLRQWVTGRTAIQRWLMAHGAGAGVHRVVAINRADVYVRRRSWPGLAFDICGEQVTANGS